MIRRAFSRRGLLLVATALATARTAGVSAAESVAGYAEPEWLVEPDWLARHLADPDLRVVALTPPDTFLDGHVAGAAQIDWPDLEIVETSDQSVAVWRDEIEARLTLLGLRPDDTVVVYDDGSLYAPRFWWILHQLGHMDTRILNGGLPAWIEAGGALESGPAVRVADRAAYVGAPDNRAIVTLDEAIAALDRPDVVLIDARTPEEYVAGHLPGAVNIPFTINAEPDDPKRWKSRPALVAIYAEAGVTPTTRVIPYCTTGVRSAATYFTLRLIGHDDVSLFTGSFKEWSNHPDLPVITGDRP